MRRVPRLLLEYIEMKQAAGSDLYDGVLTKEQVLNDINQLLEDFFVENSTRSSLLDTNYAQLWQAMHKQARSGGKRLRPYFALLAYQAYGGQAYRQVLPVAAAQELLHMSLLMHDDIIDKDYIRHGQANVAGLMRNVYQGIGAGDNSEHYANSAALLAGDLLISGSYQLIIKSSLTSDQKLIAMASLSEAIYLVGGGELLDAESSLRPISIDDSLKIADLKTARYSFVLPLLSGAVLAGASKEQQKLLEQFGIAVGVAFQLADDLLGVFGDPKVTGKSNLGDVREGKQTYLMLQAMKLATPNDKAILASSLGNRQLTGIQLNQVCQVITRSGAKADCLSKIKDFAHQAGNIVESLDISPAHKKALQTVIKKSTERTY